MDANIRKLFNGSFMFDEKFSEPNGFDRLIKNFDGLNIDYRRGSWKPVPLTT